MYAEFPFDNHWHLAGIRRRLDAWEAKYKVPLRHKTVRYTHRVGMDDETQFVLFALTWQGPAFRMIHNRNH
jgi:hypothetical protein